MPIKIASVSLSKEGKTVTCMYRYVYKDAEAKEKAPTSIIGVVLQNAMINKAVPKKTKPETGGAKRSKTMALLNDEDEPATAPAAASGAISSPIALEAFGPPVFFKYFTTNKALPKLVPGGIYEFRGVTYDIWGDGDGRASFSVQQVVPSDRTLEDFPMESRMLYVERDCPVSGMDYDKQQPGALFTLQLDNRVWEKTPNTMHCRFQVPETADIYMLTRKIDLKADDSPREIALTGGVGEQGGQMKVFSPVLDALAVHADGSEKKFAIRIGGYQKDFYALHLEVDDWMALALPMLGAAKGLIVGSVNREHTEGMITPEGYDGAIAAYATVCLDVPAMVRRIGVPVDHPGALVAGPKANYPGWAGSLVALNRATRAINLKYYDGDIAKLLAKGECWVVCNHGLESLDAVLALTPQERLDCLLGKGKINLKLPAKPVFAVYVIW